MSSVDLDVALADPETHEPVRLAAPGELARLRDAIASGRARRADGESIDALEGAYLSRSSRVAYPIYHGIAHFIVAERIEIDEGL